MVSEFAFINNIKSRYGLVKIGDDCAVLPKDGQSDLLLTVDMLIEDIDFRLEWTTPELLGHKALAVSLSDIAAMGGVPVWATLSIGVPESLWRSNFMDRFYEGWGSLAMEFNVELVGGDISRSPNKLVIDCVAGGEARKSEAITRGGAKPGDAIFITGPLGGAAAGLDLLESGVRFDPNNPRDTDGLILRQLKPWPQVTAGKALAEQRLASAMIDLSDGLSADLGHICESSNVGAAINADSIWAEPCLKKLAPLYEDRRDLFLHGGEDFELLFTAPEINRSKLERMGYQSIGTITENVRVMEFCDESERRTLTSKGFRHF